MDTGPGSTAPRPSPPGDGGPFALFVDRPVLTCMVLLAIALIGTIAFQRLPLRFLPEGGSDNNVNVYIPVRSDRSPEEVRERVAEPLEELVRTIPGLEETRVRAGTDGCRFTIDLADRLDPALAAAEIRDRLQRARLQWPEGVDRYFIWKEDGSSMPIAFFRLLTPERNPEWDYLIEEIVRPRFEAVEGVGRFDVWGLRNETMKIWFDPHEIRAHGIDFRGLLERLAADNFTEPVGELDDGEQRLLVRVDTKFRSTREILEFPVRAGLRVGDIARIVREPSQRDRLSRWDGKMTYTGMIIGSADANPVATMNRVRAAARELEDDARLEGLGFRYLVDQGEVIEDSLETLVSTALQGGLLALVALFAFLRNVRMTVAIALAIPLTLLIVGGELFFRGATLNVASMAGMTLAVGMVVDNSVVVLENIRRLRARGHGVREACVRGAREVGLPVTIATLTTVVVFLPLVFMAEEPRMAGLFAGVGIPLAVALIGSLVVALLLLPSVVHMGERRRPSPVAASGTDGGGRWSPLTGLLAFNRVVLRFGLRHRVLFSVAALALLATAVPVARSLEIVGFQNRVFRRGDVSVNMDFPRGTTLDDAHGLIRFYEEFLGREENVERWRIQGVGARYGRENGRVDIHLEEGVTVEETQAIQEEVLAEWPRRPGVRLELRNRMGGGMGGQNTSDEDDQRNFVVRLWGRDNEYLIRLAERVQSALEALPESQSVELPELQETEEVLVQLDRDRMEQLDVRPESPLGSMASGLQGRELRRFEESGREIRLVAQYDAEIKPSLQDLAKTRVWADGDFRELQEFSDIRFQRAVDNIHTIDGRTSVTVLGRRKEDVTPRAMSAAVRRVMERMPMPRGYRWSDSSPSREARQEMVSLLQSGVLSVTLVFLLMGVLFESVILPLSILVTVPFAVFGAVWALGLFHGSLDPMGITGLIILSGVVVNNGIVLLDYIERLRRQGMDRAGAILEGTRVRLRPITMTASTTIVGLLPMALFGESTGQGISYVGLSIAVAGGLAFCTLFTAVVVPMAYTFADDLSRWLRGIWRDAVGS